MMETTMVSDSAEEFSYLQMFKSYLQMFKSLNCSALSASDSNTASAITTDS